MSRCRLLNSIFYMAAFQMFSLTSYGQEQQGSTAVVDNSKVIDDVSDPTQKTVNEKLVEPTYGLSGNWKGYRSRLEENGLEFIYIYKGEVARNIKGGIEPSTHYLQNMDIKLALDGAKLLGVNGSSALFHYLYNFSDHLSEKVGDAQVTSNIEGPNTISRWYEIWLQQEFFDESLSILAGLHDLNSEFYVTESSGMFLNSSFGVGKELSQTGVNGPSIFPSTSPALRVRIASAKKFYLQAGAFNAQAGDLNKPKGSSFRLDRKDGALLISEIGFTPVSTSQSSAKYGLGYWTYTNPADRLSSDPSLANKKVINRGYFVLLDQPVNSKISAFARYGTAIHEVNQFSSCTAVGGVLTGLMTEATDQLGVGVTQVNLGKTHLDMMRSDGLKTKKSETTYEITYKFAVYDGVSLQPDFQYVVNPSASLEITDAVLASLRLEVAL